MEDSLWVHAAHPSIVVSDIRTHVRRPSATVLSFRYAVIGRIQDIILPPPAAPISTNNLWRTTCFEAFLRPSDTSGYREFNFAPSTQWAAFEFNAYREGMRQASLPAAPQIDVEVHGDCLIIDVTLSLDMPDKPHRLALSAVIEERSGGKSYWALNHPSGAPDFHHDACFDADLPPPETS